jgi:NAD(P) transhydrogenase subunit alpha
LEILTPKKEMNPKQVARLLALTALTACFVPQMSNHAWHMELILLLFVFVLAAFLGFELIAKVPSQLHTPLMSGSNAISGITVVGAILAANTSSSGLSVWIGFAAIVLATINVVGGYMVTDRMLGMFKKKLK